MSTTPSKAAVTDWLIALLTADPNGHKVGDQRAPSGPVSYPYAVVHSVPGGWLSGPALGAGAEDAGFTFQVDSVGRSRQQAEMLAARLRARIIGRLPDGSFQSPAAADPTNLIVLDRILDGSPSGVVIEGTYPNEVFTASERFVISVTAAD